MHLLIQALLHDNTIPEDLVARARDGDRNARAGLYKLFVNAMYNNCIRITGNQSDAEDVIQESFIYAFEHLGKLKNPAAFGGWLRRIVIGKAIQSFKASFKWNELDEEYHDTIAEEKSAWWLTIEMEIIHQQIKLLPNGCRQVFILYVFDDYSHMDIADNLGISESTSKSQYQRARKLLQERIIKISNGQT